MNRGTPNPPRRAGILAGALCVLAGWIPWVTPMGEPLLRLGYDLPFLFRTTIPEEIVLIQIDEETKETLDVRPDLPLPLAYHARLLEILARETPQLILYDVLLDWPAPLEVEQSGMVRALQGAGPVVLVSALLSWEEGDYQFDELLEPVAELRGASAGVGLARLPLDPDLAVRRIPRGTELLPSAAKVAAALLNEGLDPDRRSREGWLNYPGPPNRYRTAKLEQVIGGSGMPEGMFRGKLVVVGAGGAVAAAGALRDQFSTPWTRVGGGWVPGAAVHATATLNLARGDWLERMPWWLELLGLVLFGAAGGYGALRWRPLLVGLAALAAAILTWVAAFLLQATAGVWFAWTIPVMVQAPLLYLTSLGWHALRDYRDKEVLADSLARHFSPARVRQILARPGCLRPGAERREVTLLMTDIEGFSKVTALMRPEELVGLLNDYYDRVIRCVHEREGTVMDLVGDSMFALWNAPESQTDRADRALACATAMRVALRDFDRQHGELPLRTRMGLHSGVVSVGNIGSATRFDFAAVGEPVNLVARLEALNKPLGTQLLATRDFLGQVAMAPPNRLVGHFKLRGIDQPVAVHEMLEESWVTTGEEVWLKVFAEGLHHFQRGKLEAARQAFAAVVQMQPQDGPAGFYLDEIKRLTEEGLQRDWLGVVAVETG